MEDCTLASPAVLTVAELAGINAHAAALLPYDIEAPLKAYHSSRTSNASRGEGSFSGKRLQGFSEILHKPGSHGSNDVGSFRISASNISSLGGSQSGMATCVWPATAAAVTNDVPTTTIAIGWNNGRPTEVRVLHYKALPETVRDCAHRHSSPALPIATSSRHSNVLKQKSSRRYDSSTTVPAAAAASSSAPTLSSPAPIGGSAGASSPRGSRLGSRRRGLLRSLSEIWARLREGTEQLAGRSRNHRASASVLRVVDGRLVYGSAGGGGGGGEEPGAAAASSMGGGAGAVVPEILDISEYEVYDD